VTGAGEAGLVLRSGALGPATRRRRSSSCVLSFGDMFPTMPQIDSPTRVYASLYPVFSSR
jgi:hypothetical protein